MTQSNHRDTQIVYNSHDNTIYKTFYSFLDIIYYITV